MNEQQPYPKPSRVYLLLPFLFSIALAGGVYFGSLMATGGPQGKEEKKSVSKINSLLNLIEEHYVDPVDRKDLTEEAVRDILHGLDPHSVYMTPDESKRAHEELSGNFGGVGIQFLVHKDTLLVTHLIPEGPSAAAGIKPFDRIVEVDGKKMVGDLSTETVFNTLRGEVGSRLKIKVFRPSVGKLIDFKLTRGLIPVNTVETAIMLNKETGYIRLSQFGARTHADFLEAFNRLRNREFKKLILDLRDNGGGYLGEAQRIADEFLPAGKVIVYTEGEHSPRDIMKASSKGNVEKVPLVILINHNSASASEIVAGAVQDNDRGLIIGRRSFGKGLVQQEMNPFGDESSIRLTIARYYTPTGRCIQKPYGKDINYAMEQYERYENNEFFVPDSSIFVDSLKYTTPMGKVVYGGGGIMPDIFVPIDTGGRNEFFNTLYFDRVFAEYAFDLVEKNRKRLDLIPDYSYFSQSFSVSDAEINGLIAYATSKKVSGTPQQINHCKSLLKHHLKAEIARYLFNSDGYFRVIAEKDPDILRALEELKKQK